MRQTRTMLTIALGVSALAIIVTGRLEAQSTQASGVTPMAEKPPLGRTVGDWQPSTGLTQIPIWPGRAPDMAGKTQPPESVLRAVTPEAGPGVVSEAVFDVTKPTITVVPPRGRGNGTAVIVFPGGGFQAVVITSEGTEICDWITARGMTCIISKYRVPDSDHHWDKNCDCTVTPKIAFALQDAQRTIRLVRAQAKILHIDPHKIGVMGFSAGGYLVAQTSNIFAPIYKPVDEIDRISSRPDFALAVYPGHLCRDGKMLDPAIHVTAQTPPTFLLQAWDDPVDFICNSTIYARALNDAGVPSEIHLFAKGGHAFALRDKVDPVAIWPTLAESWLKGIGML